jgi:hypothetical protein
MIAATSSFTVGRFTVLQRPRHDNPYFAVFVIYLGEVFIGKQFSMPSESDCQSLGRNHEPREPAPERPTLKYGRRAAIPTMTCERCGTTFTRGLGSLCVPCKERKK